MQDIEEMETRGYQLTLEEFSNALRNLKNKFYKISNYNFEDIDLIENKLYELQIDLIMRSLREKSYMGLDKIISEKDIDGLKIAIYNKIHKFMQSKNQNIKDAAKRASNMMMSNDNALYSKTMWNLINDIQLGRNNSIGVDTEATSLAIIPNKRNNSFFEKILKVLKKEPTLPLDTSDLKKISIDWLAKYVPKEILEEKERARLKEEKRVADKIFIPDARRPIYDIFSKEIHNREKSNNTEKAEIKYTDKYGMEKTICIDVYSDCYSDYDVGFELLNGNEKVNVEKWDKWNALIGLAFLPNVIEYTEFIDRVLGTNLKEELFQDLEKYIVESKLREDYCVFFEDFKEERKYIKKNFKVLNNLFESYKNILKECNDTIYYFNNEERAKRENFYKKHSFREEIKVKKMEKAKKMKID